MTLYRVCVVNDYAPIRNEIRLYATSREIVAVVSGGPCQVPQPVVLSGRIAAWLPCARRLPAHRQCVACRITVVVVATVHTFDGTVMAAGVAA